MKTESKKQYSSHFADHGYRWGRNVMFISCLFKDEFDQFMSRLLVDFGGKLAENDQHHRILDVDKQPATVPDSCQSLQDDHQKK